MVKVTIRYLVDEKPDVAVEAEYPDGLTDAAWSMLWTAFIQLVKTRRGDFAESPQPTAPDSSQQQAEREP